jgi:hypothetical protein
MAKFDWHAWLQKAFVAAPTVIASVEEIHADKDTKTKAQLAAEALKNATNVAAMVDPNDAQTIGQVSQVAGNIVNAFNTPPPGKS